MILTPPPKKKKNLLWTTEVNNTLEAIKDYNQGMASLMEMQRVLQQSANL